MENTRPRVSQETFTTAERLLAQTFSGDIRLEEMALYPAFRFDNAHQHENFLPRTA
jgi:hypothetical protein